MKIQSMVFKMPKKEARYSILYTDKALNRQKMRCIDNGSNMITDKAQILLPFLNIKDAMKDRSREFLFQT